ncbi:MAG TPA: hypothetical protein VE597_03885 [Geminicoccaceae bacterium]|nr:hypothetical protein [Geminicoccaceae bacterium]
MAIQALDCCAPAGLRLHGWSFDLKEGEVRAYVPQEGAFAPLTLELAERLQSA